MAKDKRKVVLLIVEGESDEALLIDRLRELFKEYNIRFEPQHGDILYNAKNQGKSIKDIIGEVVKEVLIKRKFKMPDILAVIHIIDTDGCLISDDKIIIDNNQSEMTVYKEDSISVLNDAQKRNIQVRNESRGRNIRTMNSVKNIISNKLIYQMYYFSRNLEHVIFNEPNPDSEYKLDNVESFVEELTVPIEEFLKPYTPPTSTTMGYDERYKESWSYISEGINSLQRLTNIPMMFEFIKMGSELIKKTED